MDDDAVHVVGYLGDATGNKAYSGLDAQRVQRVVVNLDSGFVPSAAVDPSLHYARMDPVVIADVTGNGALSGLDATRIQQELAQLTQVTAWLIVTSTCRTGGIFGASESFHTGEPLAFSPSQFFRDRTGTPVFCRH
ncbi:MAG: hypothetical protein HY000_14265 [Planctomycetes bacterium]|nr:hypothetical protein [Planctomycetota bacterium]